MPDALMRKNSARARDFLRGLPGAAARRLAAGLRPRVESLALRHFFALKSRQKNMKPEKALLHTPTGVLHPIQTSLFR